MNEALFRETYNARVDDRRAHERRLTEVQAEAARARKCLREAEAEIMELERTIADIQGWHEGMRNAWALAKKKERKA